MEQKSKIPNKKTSKFALNWLTAKIFMHGNYHFYSTWRMKDNSFGFAVMLSGNRLHGSVAKSFELQGAANSSPTRKNCSEGAQFLLVLKSARKSKFGRNLGIFPNGFSMKYNPKLSDWAPKLGNTT